MNEVELWRDVVGWEDRYEVSTFGRVRSKSFLKHGKGRSGAFSFWTKPKVLKPSLDGSGYPQVVLQREGEKKTVKVHRLVATAHIDNPDNLPQVNHKDSVRTNCAAYNLEWSTAQDNILHSYSQGFASNQGESHPRAVLTEDLVREIRRLRATGLTGQVVADLLSIKKATVYAADSRKNWSHVT